MDEDDLEFSDVNDDEDHEESFPFSLLVWIVERYPAQWGQVDCRTGALPKKSDSHQKTVTVTFFRPPIPNPWPPNFSVTDFLKVNTL